jgi:ubiquinone/menaquinone biosynthesis C-methylase UbiE
MGTLSDENQSEDQPFHPFLYQMQPLDRFSDRAVDYACYRPSYPLAAIATILHNLGDPDHLMAADIGAGTGISARLLADQGVQVWAVEPNEAMQRAAAAHPRVTWQVGTAEKTGLPDTSVDLVTCFQAFHWFDPEASLSEFHRILKPSGRLALVWNNRDRTDPLTAGYSDLVKQLSKHHPAEERLGAEQALQESQGFDHLQHQTFSYKQAMDLAGLVGRAQSVSYISKDPQTQQALMVGLQALYEQWADAQGLVYLAYRTEVFLAEPKREWGIGNRGWGIGDR